MTYKYILFDLDGTISASGPGIIKAMQYGLTAAGINETDPATLKSFIGPPLNVQIQKIYGLSEKDTLAVIMKFREQYDIIKASLIPPPTKVSMNSYPP